MIALYLESVAGIAGDMFAASFVDAGLVTIDELQNLASILEFTDINIKIKNVLKANTQATHLEVQINGEGWKRLFTHTHADHWHVHYTDIDLLLKKSTLGENVKKIACQIFHALAQAEAEAHGVSVQNVEFHEVGAVDSILDVVMAAYCIDKISPKQIYASPVKLGRGVVTIEHGTYPVPPPAAAYLARSLCIQKTPDQIQRENVELSTPTGLAILKVLNPVFIQGWPTGVVKATGMGAGTMDLKDYPNIFRLTVLDEKTTNTKLPYEEDNVIEMSCNLDDQTAEKSAWVVEKLFENGALDVWQTPVVGKKNRSALVLSVLALESRWQECADFILKNSSTFGIRYRQWNRLKCVRKEETRQILGQAVRFNLGYDTNGLLLKEKAEFEDLKKTWE